VKVYWPAVRPVIVAPCQATGVEPGVVDWAMLPTSIVPFEKKLVVPSISPDGFTPTTIEKATVVLTEGPTRLRDPSVKFVPA
jgi:hypothetical protein